MGIRFYCPQGHKLNVKEFQAGRRGICPFCGEKILIPTESSRPSSHEERKARRAGVKALVAPLVADAPESSEQPSARPVEPAPAPLPSIADPVAQNPAPPAMATLVNSATATFSNGSSGIASDPFSESPGLVWYVRPPTGGQFGPATSEILRGWLSEGRISNDTLVWREGWRDWLEAGGVFPQLHLAFINPLEALKIPETSLMVPQKTITPIPKKTGISPQGMVWMIAGLALFTLFAIAGTIYLLWR